MYILKRRVRPWAGRLAAAVIVASLPACDSGPTGSPPPPPPPPGEGGYVIEFSTYLGGADLEEIREPRILPDGRLLMGAQVRSSNLPITAGAYQPVPAGGLSDSWLGILREDGSGFDAATYFGGAGTERPAYGLEALPGGDIVFASGTTSPNIPTSSQAWVRDRVNPLPTPGDGYVCRISGDLTTLRWCTYTGGGWPRGGLAVAAGERIWVVGRVLSDNFPTTPDAVQSVPRGEDDAFLLLLSADGRSAEYATRLGGTGTDVGETITSVLLDSSGAVYATGISRSLDFPTTGGAAQPASTGVADAFALSLDPSRNLRFATLVGGSQDDFAEHRTFLMPDGSQLMAGGTSSSLPSVPGGGSHRSYLALVSPDGAGISYVAPPAAELMDALLGPEVDASGRVYLFGMTTSPNFPVTDNAIQRSPGGGEDGFLMVLEPDMRTIEYATYLGGSGSELIRGAAIGSDGRIYLVGRTESDDFPVVSAFQPARGGDADGFIVRLDPR